MEPSSDSQEPVLRYKATTPAVRLSPTPSADELAFDWTLSEPDKQLVLKHRGRENICRFAVQLCVLKKYGRFLTDYRQAPPAVLGYLCKQLEIKPLVALTGRARGNTESGYQREIIRYLGWQPYDDHAARRLTDWVAEHLFGVVCT